MRLKTTLKKLKFNKKVFTDLKKLETKIKAGYPYENPETFEQDKNGFSAIYKANEINFTNSNFKPYLLISLNNNKIKYKKNFVFIAKSSQKKQIPLLNKLGADMVKDIKKTIKNNQLSPASNNKGCIYGSVTFAKVKR